MKKHEKPLQPKPKRRKKLPPTVKTGNPRGKPSMEHKLDIAKIENYAARGLTKEDIAHNLGLAVSTYHKYRLKFPEMDEAFERGRAKGRTVITSKWFELISKGNWNAIERGLTSLCGIKDESKVDFGKDTLKALRVIRDDIA